MIKKIPKKKVIAVIPAYNESKYISAVVRETLKYVDEVIVVDDASTDNTSQLAKSAGAIVIRHVVNLGLGGALLTGCEAALLHNADIIVTLDGDGQHDPKEIQKIISPILKNEAEAVFGERPFNNQMPLTKKLGNRFFSIYAKSIFGIKIRDTQTGFRAFTSSAFEKIRWNSSDYSVASEILINAERANLHYIPIKISTIYREKNKGTTPLDGLKIAGRMANLAIKRKNDLSI